MVNSFPSFWPLPVARSTGDLGNYLPWINGAFRDNQSLGVKGKRKKMPLLLTLRRIYMRHLLSQACLGCVPSSSIASSKQEQSSGSRAAPMRGWLPRLWSRAVRKQGTSRSPGGLPFLSLGWGWGLALSKPSSPSKQSHWQSFHNQHRPPIPSSPLLCHLSPLLGKGLGPDPRP